MQKIAAANAAAVWLSIFIDRIAAFGLLNRFIGEGPSMR
jgi:hypothetical protein